MVWIPTIDIQSKKEFFQKFLKQNSKASNLVFVEATHNIEGKSVNAVAQYIIDNKLPEDSSKFFFVSFTVGSRYRMIVQKYSIKDYASYILFGYSEGNISYHRKVAGKWI